MSTAQYLTVGETAAYLNTSERFVRRLIAERRIAFHKIGRHVRVSAADCVKFLDSLVAATGKAFLVHREELPDEDGVAVALRDGFGAEPGDRIVHVLTGRPGEPRVAVEEFLDAVIVG